MECISNAGGDLLLSSAPRERDAWIVKEYKLTNEQMANQQTCTRAAAATWRIAGWFVGPIRVAKSANNVIQFNILCVFSLWSSDK